MKNQPLLLLLEAECTFQEQDKQNNHLNSVRLAAMVSLALPGYVVSPGGWRSVVSCWSCSVVWSRGLVVMIISARTCCTWKSSYDSLFLLVLLARRSDGPA